jgi:hypothetical protein
MSARPSRRAPGGRALPVALVWAVALVGSDCRGQLRFEEPMPDGGAAPSGDAMGRSADAACGDGSCGFERGGCQPTQANCRFECDARRTCQSGTSCSGVCELASSCAVTAADSANLRCGTDAHCSFVVGPGSSVSCSAGSGCDVRCPGSCSLTCATGATCTLACGTSSPRSITTSATCP